MGSGMKIFIFGLLMSITCIACIMLELPTRTVQGICGKPSMKNARCQTRIGGSISATCTISVILLFLYIIIKASRRG